MTEISSWRANDVVAYELLRESASTLTALLTYAASSDVSAPDGARLELTQLRRDLLTIDGYDRARVNALAAQIDARVRELSGASR